MPVISMPPLSERDPHISPMRHSRRHLLPSDPVEKQPCIGLIGMGDMGGMYAKHFSKAGWKK